MKRRKALFLANREEFLRLLRLDVAMHVKRAKRGRLRPAIRLNVSSDLDWSWFVGEFPEIRFYDYTKVRSRMRGEWPGNYDLTYSVNERSHWRTVRGILENGRNVAAVFATRYVPSWRISDPLPASYRFGGKVWRVVDGDRHDLRLRDVDGQGVIVGLRFKGGKKRKQVAIEKGFCLPC